MNDSDEDDLIAEACEPIEDYESEAGIRLFFERLRQGWYVDRAGRMRPPRLSIGAPGADEVPLEGCGECGPPHVGGEGHCECECHDDAPVCASPNLNSSRAER